MYIKDAQIRDFRNIEKLETGFSPKFNIFFGKNAQGKTNLLEALSLSLNGVSHRESSTINFIRKGAEDSRLVLNVANDRGITTNLTLYIAERKLYRINGNKVTSRSELLKEYNLVMFTPEDLRLIKGYPKDRRRFLNESISLLYPAYHEALRDYRRTLKQRNSLLKDYSKRNIVESMLDVYDQKLADLGAKIFITRLGFLRKTEKLTDSLNRGVAGDEKVTFRYSSNIIDSPGDAKNAESIFLKKLKEARKEDIFRQRTSTGVHHDDINIFINGMDTKKFASQGQQRSIALCMKLSVIELLREKFDEWPIVLLDDVMSDLDPFRQKQILEILKNTQSFITCVDYSFVSEDMEYNLYRIKDGKLTGGK